MMVKTPYAEAAMTGARAEFHVTSELARIDVNSGDIQVRRAVGRKFVTVHAGEYAEAPEKGGLAVKSLSGQVPEEQSPPAAE
jgi:ferric-dicitrate binding protein FerR (iron transport regulator)